MVDGRRKCAEPGCDRYFIPKSTRNRYCLKHRKTKPIDRSHYVKYGAGHRALRKDWGRRILADGVLCARCGEEISPHDHWDLGHLDEGGPREYSGPEHASCNRATSSHAVGRVNGRRRTSVDLGVPRRRLKRRGGA